jgi:hypothetical protein
MRGLLVSKKTKKLSDYCNLALESLTYATLQRLEIFAACSTAATFSSSYPLVWATVSSSTSNSIDGSRIDR